MGVPSAVRRIQLSRGMPTAPKDEAVARAWSWALTKAGMTKERGPPAGPAPSRMSVMIPLSCRSTTLSVTPRSGPRNRLVAAISVAMTVSPNLVGSIHQLPLRTRRQEFAREHLCGRRRAGELIALDHDADGARHAVILDVADADLLHLGRDDQLVEGILQPALLDGDVDQIVVVQRRLHAGVLVLGHRDCALVDGAHEPGHRLRVRRDQ